MGKSGDCLRILQSPQRQPHPAASRHALADPSKATALSAFLAARCRGNRPLLASISHVGAAGVSFPTGTFSPEWLYYRERLWYQPTITLRAGQVIDFSPYRTPQAQILDGLLSPCWVNAHTHLELSHLQGSIPPGRGMVDFIQRMGPQRGSASAAEIRAALIAAQLEGTCAFVSHQNMPLLPNAIPDNVLVQPLIEYFGLRMPNIHRRLRARRATEKAPLTPHSFYSLSRKHLRRARRPTTFPLSIHFMESIEERLWLESGRGPFAVFFRRFVRHPRPPRWQAHLRRLVRRAPAIWLVHATEAPSLLMKQLLDRYPTLYIVLCPEANMYLFRRIPDLGFWKRYADRLLIGTDSLANSPSLSVWGTVKQLWMVGFGWEAILKAAVDTPRRWLTPPPAWTLVAPIGSEGALLPQSRAYNFTAHELVYSL